MFNSTLITKIVKLIIVHLLSSETSHVTSFNLPRNPMRHILQLIKDVLVCSGSHNRELKLQNLTCLQFWKLEGPDQGAIRVGV